MTSSVFQQQQNFQVVILLKHQWRVKMMDLITKLSKILLWHDKGIDIYHITRGNLIFAKAYMELLNEFFDFILLPMFDQFNRIKGTQLVLRNDSPLYFVFENDDSNQHVILSNAIYDKQEYKIYRSKMKCFIEAVIAYCKIKESVFVYHKRSFNTLHIKTSSKCFTDSPQLSGFDRLQPMKRSNRFRCKTR